tara:strand:- start:4336 stop:4539 length:204 start_codon:yes stop_codon:yes gene_type:complete
MKVGGFDEFLEKSIVATHSNRKCEKCLVSTFKSDLKESQFTMYCTICHMELYTWRNKKKCLVEVVET